MFVGELRHFPRGDAAPVLVVQASALEERPEDGPADAPEVRRAFQDVLDLRALRTVERREAEARKKVADRDPDDRVRRDDRLLRRQHVRAALQQRRRQPRGHVGWMRLVGQRRAAGDGPRRVAEQNRDLVLLGDDLSVEVGNRRRRARERGRRP